MEPVPVKNTEKPIAKRSAALKFVLTIGVHESIIPAVVAPMVSPDRRASTYGLFTAGYGIFWFLGSAIMGILYDRSVTATIIFCVATQLAAVPIFFVVRRQYGTFKTKHQYAAGV
jgi:predicted MFS family arabinose efflux permease